MSAFIFDNAELTMLMVGFLVWVVLTTVKIVSLEDKIAALEAKYGYLNRTPNIISRKR